MTGVSLGIHFSQFEDPNFENFLGQHAPRPPNGFRLTADFNLSLEKSGNSIPSGEWTPCILIATILFAELHVESVLALIVLTVTVV